MYFLTHKLPLFILIYFFSLWCFAETQQEFIIDCIRQTDAQVEVISLKGSEAIDQKWEFPNDNYKLKAQYDLKSDYFQIEFMLGENALKFVAHLTGGMSVNLNGPSGALQLVCTRRDLKGTRIID